MSAALQAAAAALRSQYEAAGLISPTQIQKVTFGNTPPPVTNKHTEAIDLTVDPAFSPLPVETVSGYVDGNGVKWPVRVFHPPATFVSIST